MEWKQLPFVADTCDGFNHMRPLIFSFFFTFLMVKVQGCLEVALQKPCFNPFCEKRITKVKVNVDQGSFHFDKRVKIVTRRDSDKFGFHVKKKKLTQSLSCSIVMMGTRTCKLCLDRVLIVLMTIRSILEVFLLLVLLFGSKRCG